MGYKFLRVRDSTWSRLWAIRKPGESFDALLNRLIENQCSCTSEIPRFILG